MYIKIEANIWNQLWFYYDSVACNSIIRGIRAVAGAAAAVVLRASLVVPCALRHQALKLYRVPHGKMYFFKLTLTGRKSKSDFFEGCFVILRLDIFRHYNEFSWNAYVLCALFWTKYKSLSVKKNLLWFCWIFFCWIFFWLTWLKNYWEGQLPR